MDGYLSAEGHSSLATIDDFNVFASCGRKIFDKLEANLNKETKKERKDAESGHKYAKVVWSSLGNVLFPISWQEEIAEVKEDLTFYLLIGKFAEHLTLENLGQTITLQRFAKVILDSLAKPGLETKHGPLLLNFRHHVCRYGLDTTIGLSVHAREAKNLVWILHCTGLLHTRIVYGDGTTTAAKKGGDNIGFSGHKKMKHDKVVAFCDRNCNVQLRLLYQRQATAMNRPYWEKPRCRN